MRILRKPFLVIVSMFCMFMLFAAGTVYGQQTADLDQTTRLAALAKVWGLLKYYHPEVHKGEIDWDEVLMDAIPNVKTAQDFDSFNQEIENMIMEAGGIDILDYNPQTPALPDNEGNFKWLKNSKIFSLDVIKKLKTLRWKYEYTPNYYALMENTLVPSFINENQYREHYYPNENMRLMALFRYWNAIQYFFAYKKEIGEDWEDVLEEFIPPMISAADGFDYNDVLREISVRIRDAHAAFIGIYYHYRVGYHCSPMEVRYIENKTVVTRVFNEIMDPPGALQVGDVILRCRGEDINDYRESLRDYVNHSNEWTLQRNINDFVTKGQTPQLTFQLLRNGNTLDVTVQGVSWSAYQIAQNNANNAMEKWKMLDNNIGYVNLGRLIRDDVDTLMAEMINTQAIIFDVRYQARGTIRYLTPYLHPGPTNIYSCKIFDKFEPGTFEYYGPYGYVEEPRPDYYRGKVVILADERTQSHAELTVMGLSVSPDAVFIGHPTAGADGNAVIIALPGYVLTWFTGVGMYWPDGSDTQRVGIVPDIETKPTVAGIRQGRDELLEKAIHYIENN